MNSSGVLAKLLGVLIAVGVFTFGYSADGFSLKRTKRGYLGHYGFAPVGYGSSFSPHLFFGYGVGGPLAVEGFQRNLYSLHQNDLGNAFHVGHYAAAVAAATRTRAAAGTTFKGAHGRR